MAAIRQLLVRLRHHWRLHRVNGLPFAERGTGVILHNGSVFEPAERIRFGNDIYVGPEARFHADGGIVVCDNVIFAPCVTIYTSNHIVEGSGWLPYGPMAEKGEVWIGPNVWIGAQAILLAGARIGEGAVVAAGSVVNRDVPPLALAAGNPAQVRRYRDPAEYQRLVSEGKFYLRAKRLGQAPPGEWRELPRRAKPMEQTAFALEQSRTWRLDEHDFQR